MTDFLLHLGWLALSMSSVILLALLWSRKFGKGFSAKSRYILWTVIVLSLCIGVGLFRLPSVFCLSFSLPEPSRNITQQARPTPQSTPSSSVGRSEQEKNEAQSTAPSLPAEPDTLPAGTQPPSLPQAQKNGEKPERSYLPAALLCIWAIGAIGFFTAGLAAYTCSVRRYSKRKKPEDMQAEEMLCIMCRKHGIKKAPALYVCSNAGSPVLYGYFKPAIILPHIPLSKNALAGILAHELTHYRRGDLWIKLICLLAQSLFWFDPLVHIAAARCNSEMELSCDEAVLSGRSDEVRRSYGNVMLDIVKHCSSKNGVLTTQFNPQKSEIKKRFVNILDMTKKRRGKAVIAAAMALCITAGAFVGCSLKDGKENAVDEKLLKCADILTDHLVHHVMTYDWLDGMIDISDADIAEFVKTLGVYYNKNKREHPYYGIVSVSDDEMFFVADRTAVKEMSAELFGKEYSGEGLDTTELFDERSNTYRFPIYAGAASSPFFFENMTVDSSDKFIYAECNIVNSRLYEYAEKDYGKYRFTYEIIGGEHLRFVKAERMIQTETFNVGDGVTSVDKSTFDGVDTDGIKELSIGKDVENADLAHLNTLPALEKITADPASGSYLSASTSTDASVLISLRSNEILFIPSKDNNYISFFGVDALTDRFGENETVSVYIAGSVSSIYYTYEEQTAMWFLKSVEHGGIKKTFEGDRQLTGNCRIYGFRIENGLVLSRDQNGWPDALIFKDGSLTEYTPQRGDTWSEDINRCDGMYFYPGEKGELLFTRTAPSMVSIQTCEWFLDLRSRDQFWQASGYVTFSGGELVYNPTSTRTVSDYFIAHGETIEKAFEDLSADGLIPNCDTLDEMLERNAGKEMCK